MPEKYPYKDHQEFIQKERKKQKKLEDDRNMKTLLKQIEITHEKLRKQRIGINKLSV